MFAANFFVEFLPLLRPRLTLTRPRSQKRSLNRFHFQKNRIPYPLRLGIPSNNWSTESDRVNRSCLSKIHLQPASTMIQNNKYIRDFQNFFYLPGFDLDARQPIYLLIAFAKFQRWARTTSATGYIDYRQYEFSHFVKKIIFTYKEGEELFFVCSSKEEEERREDQFFF